MGAQPCPSPPVPPNPATLPPRSFSYAWPSHSRPRPSTFPRCVAIPSPQPTTTPPLAARRVSRPAPRLACTGPLALFHLPRKNALGHALPSVGRLIVLSAGVCQSGKGLYPLSDVVAAQASAVRNEHALRRPACAVCHDHAPTGLLGSSSVPCEVCGPCMRWHVQRALSLRAAEAHLSTVLPRAR
jgi:hypothetical protein